MDGETRTHTHVKISKDKPPRLYTSFTVEQNGATTTNKSKCKMTRVMASRKV